MDTSKNETKLVVPGERWLALDLVRFLAVILMVQGHAFTALLDPKVQAASWYGLHRFVHGYTAPIFLFVAGLGFGYSTFKRFDEHISPSPELWRRMRRYALLVGIGYGLHFPANRIVDLLSGREPTLLREALAVDILQTIGVSLAILQVSILVLRRTSWFVGAVAALAAATIFGAPWIWQVRFGATLPVSIAAYLNADTGSLFPLFPWSGFLCVGVLFGYAASRVPPAQIAQRFTARLVFASGLLIVLPILAAGARLDPFPAAQFWRTNPYYTLFRLGNVVGCLAVLAFVERWLRERRRLATTHLNLESFVEHARTVGEHSLLIYVAHLWILYGALVDPGLLLQLGGKLGLAAATTVTIALLGAMISLAIFWERRASRKKMIGRVDPAAPRSSHRHKAGIITGWTGRKPAF